MTCLTRGCKRRGILAGRCRSHATDRADDAFSKFIRARDKACQECGVNDPLQCAHLISRRYRATRWDPTNAVALCIRCHKRFTEHPLEWDLWCSVHLGQEGWESLRRQALHGERAVVESWLETFAA